MNGNARFDFGKIAAIILGVMAIGRWVGAYGPCDDCSVSGGGATNYYCAGSVPSNLSWSCSYEIDTGSDCASTNVTGTVVVPTSCGYHTLTLGGGCPCTTQAVVAVVGVTISPASGWEACVGSTNSFTASGCPSGGSYFWSCGGSTSNSTDCVFDSPGSNAVVTVTYSLGGVPCQASSTGTVHEVRTASASASFLDPDGSSGCNTPVVTVGATLEFCTQAGSDVKLTVELNGPVSYAACMDGQQSKEYGIGPDWARLRKVVGQYQPGQTINGSERIQGNSRIDCSGSPIPDFCPEPPCPSNGRWICVGWKIESTTSGALNIILQPQQMPPSCSTPRVCIPP
jgi:hypothetical protein